MGPCGKEGDVLWSSASLPLKLSEAWNSILRTVLKPVLLSYSAVTLVGTSFIHKNYKCI